MFKMIFRVAIAFALVWMLIPHGSDPGYGQRGLAAVKQYFSAPSDCVPRKPGAPKAEMAQHTAHSLAGRDASASACSP